MHLIPMLYYYAVLPMDFFYFTCPVTPRSGIPSILVRQPTVISDSGEFGFLNDTWVLVRTFGVVYDRNIFYTCQSPN